MSLGIVGYGRLGKKVAKIARSFGMTVDYYDPYVRGGVNNIIELVEKSDVLSLHAVSNYETKNLISREVLSYLKEDSIVVNTARGELLDTEALVDLLEDGKLWGAALDTVDGEYSSNFIHDFINSRVLNYANKNDNLILTPHIAGSTVDAWCETEKK